MLRLTRRQGVLVGILIVLALAPAVALGAGMPGVIVTCSGTDCTICNLADLAQNILNASIFIAVFLSAILFAWAGLRMLTSPANASEYGKGKNLLYNVLIGFVIIMSAWIVVDTLMRVMVGGDVGGAPWNSICNGLNHLRNCAPGTSGPTCIPAGG